jgi:hypothetical protein
MIAVASIFSQILSRVPRAGFVSPVKKRGAERQAKGFTCWERFAVNLKIQNSGVNKRNYQSVEDNSVLSWAEVVIGNVFRCQH